MSPAQIREAIAQARADLGAHLRALGDPQPSSGGDGPGDKTMPTRAKATAKPKQTAAKSEKTVAKSEKTTAKAEPPTKSKSKSSGAKSKKGTPARTVKTAAATAGHVLDTMAAGAVVGAVKAAAQSITEKETKALKGKSKSSPSTGDVLGEMAPDAAVGAIVGAAQAVMPEESEPTEAKPKRRNSKVAKGGTPKQK